MDINKIGRVLNIIFFTLVTLAALGLMVSIFPISGNYRILTVLSGSMEPAIHTGSVVIVKPENDYKIGDVITFGEISKTKIPTTHRIKDIKVSEGRNVYITKGDANNAEDNGEVLQEDVKGKVLFSIPWVGYVLNFVKQPVGFAVVIIIPSVLIIWEEIKKIYREVANSRGKKTEVKEGKEENKNA